MYQGVKSPIVPREKYFPREATPIECLTNRIVLLSFYIIDNDQRQKETNI